MDLHGLAALMQGMDQSNRDLIGRRSVCGAARGVAGVGGRLILGGDIAHEMARQGQAGGLGLKFRRREHRFSRGLIVVSLLDRAFRRSRRARALYGDIRAHRGVRCIGFRRGCRRRTNGDSGWRKAKLRRRLCGTGRGLGEGAEVTGGSLVRLRL